MTKYNTEYTTHRVHLTKCTTQSTPHNIHTHPQAHAHAQPSRPLSASSLIPPPPLFPVDQVDVPSEALQSLLQQGGLQLKQAEEVSGASVDLVRSQLMLRVRGDQDSVPKVTRGGGGVCASRGGVCVSCIVYRMCRACVCVEGALHIGVSRRVRLACVTLGPCVL